MLLYVDILFLFSTGWHCSVWSLLALEHYTPSLLALPESLTSSHWLLQHASINLATITTLVYVVTYIIMDPLAGGIMNFINHSIMDPLAGGSISIMKLHQPIIMDCIAGGSKSILQVENRSIYLHVSLSWR